MNYSKAEVVGEKLSVVAGSIGGSPAASWHITYTVEIPLIIIDRSDTMRLWLMGIVRKPGALQWGYAPLHPTVALQTKCHHRSTGCQDKSVLNSCGDQPSKFSMTIFFLSHTHIFKLHYRTRWEETNLAK